MSLVYYFFWTQCKTPTTLLMVLYTNQLVNNMTAKKHQIADNLHSADGHTIQHTQ